LGLNGLDPALDCATEGPDVNVLVIMLAVLGVVAVVAWNIYDSRQRRQLLQTWARAKRLTFAPGRDGRIDNEYPGFKCLRQGHSRYACNVVSGRLGDLEVKAFDYHYTTGHGKNRRHHRISALVARSPLQLKPLYLRRENVLDKVTEFFGLDDIDFESAEFSRKFYVKAEDKRWAYDVLHQRTMDYLLQAPEFAVEFAWGHVIAWRSHRFAPADFEAAAELIQGILDRLPDYVKDQQAPLTWNGRGLKT
jgi:hypothetical protein